MGPMDGSVWSRGPVATSSVRPVTCPPERRHPSGHRDDHRPSLPPARTRRRSGTPPANGNHRRGLIRMDQDTENRVERRRRRRRGIVALLGAISMLTIGAGSISLAQFTDTAGATWNFTAGTIDISVNPTAFAAINPMMPGDVNTQPLTVTNGGTA